MEVEEAIRLLERTLNSGSVRRAGRLCVVRSATQFYSWGYALQAEYERYLETGEKRYAAIGFGPFVFDLQSSSVVRLVSGIPFDVALERWRNGDERVLLELYSIESGPTLVLESAAGPLKAFWQRLLG